MKFDIITYKNKIKRMTLNIAKLLVNSNYFKDTEINEGRLISVDFIPSNGKLYVLELNTDLLLSDIMVYSQTGFDFDELCSFIYSRGYKKIVLVEREDEEFIVPFPEWTSLMKCACAKYDIEFSCLYYPSRSGNGFNCEDLTFYIKNIPVHSRESKDGIIHLSRHKDNFRNFLNLHGLDHWMPPFKEKINSEKMVAKIPNLDNGQGITFTDKNDGEYVEEFIEHDFDDLNNTVICKGLALLNKTGVVWIRPGDSDTSISQSPGFIENDNKVVLEREGIVGQFGENTNVYMANGGCKLISNIEVGDKVISPVIDDVYGKMYLEWENDDTLKNGWNEPWRNSFFTSLETLQLKISTVSGISKINFRTWVVINDVLEISLCEYLLVERNNTYSFIKSGLLLVGDKLISHNKLPLSIEKISTHHGKKCLYGFSCLENDIIATELGISILKHHFVSY